MSTEWVPYMEGALPQMRELERHLQTQNIEVELAKPPPKACCGGACGCGSKLQLLVRQEDVPRVSELMQAQWLAALEREGTVKFATVEQSAVPDGELRCPACSFAGPLQAGACADCGLQLE